MRDEFLMLFSLASVQGMLDPFTPLGIDMFRLMMAAFGRFFGVRRTLDTQRAFFEAGGRLYLNFTPFFRNRSGRWFLRGLVTLVDPGSSAAVNTLFNDPRLAIAGRMKARTRLGFAGILLRVARRVLFNIAMPARGRARLQRESDAMTRHIQAGHSTVRSLSERLTVMEDAVAAMPRVFFNCLVPAVASGMAPLQLLRKMCAGLPDGERLVLQLTRGLPHNVTTEMDLVLWDIARRIRGDPDADQHFSNTEPADLAGQYTDGGLPPTAQRAIADFMERYGMRGVGEIDMGRLRWRDEPTSLMQALMSLLQVTDEEAAPDAVFRRSALAAETAATRIVAMLGALPGGRGKARRARFIIGRVRELGGLRESPKFAAIKAMTAQREGLRASGAELAAAGVLEEPDDVFFLRFPELKAMAAGSSGDWKELVAERRRNYDRECRRRMVPRILLTDGTAFYEGVSAKGAAAQEDGAVVLAGSPVSPGVVVGTVRVVRDPRGAHLAPGEILVCPGTDPAWTPLFMAAGGLVMEVGGMMTHGSVVAREYGIPAVVGVSRATTRLSTGQRVRVDGNTGRVTIVG
jgi:pyruvate,water dikinase